MLRAAGVRSVLKGRDRHSLNGGYVLCRFGVDTNAHTFSYMLRPESSLAGTAEAAN